MTLLRIALIWCTLSLVTSLALGLVLRRLACEED